MKKSFILLCGVVLCVLAVFFVGCDKTTEIYPNELSSNWMGAISDDAALSEISIPGTHDSGATRSGFIYNFGHNQDLSIIDQLSVGVRFLDVRLTLKKDKLKVYHGVLNQKKTFEEVVDDCSTFLKAHSTETIIMSVKKESGDDISNAVKTVVQKDPTLWYLENEVPTLGEVRGKIVLFRRYDGDIGLNLSDGFQDNATFDVDNGVKCHVQDYYKVGTKNGLSSEWTAIEECLKYAKTAEKGEYVINFTSAYYTTLSFINLPKIKQTAAYVHPLVSDYLTSHVGDRFGIVLFDLVNEELATAVYKTNIN